MAPSPRSPSSTARRPLRRLLIVAAALATLALGVFAWAWSSTDTSTLARALLWMDADVGDQRRFPARVIPTDGRPSSLPNGAEVTLLARGPGDRSVRPLEHVLRDSHTRAFIVVHHDRLVYERYFAGASPKTLETSFSIAKSFVSTLVGIAIAEGRIGGVDDALTDYVPELKARDRRFARITVRDLLTMRSGLRYHESSFPWPGGDDTYTYYGTDLRKAALKRSQIERPPGQEWLYNNYNPLLLGLVLERATGMAVSAYMSAKLWQPLGAVRDATWSLDSKDSGFEKLESGLNATARDYARFGLLFMSGGRWNGRRIVPSAWVRTATAPHVATDYENRYGYLWWIDGRRPENFYAFGNYGQYIYVAPGADTVVVRMGSDWGARNPTWLALFRDLTDQLTGAAGTSNSASSTAEAR